MLCKGRVFAVVAAFGAFAVFVGANAQPGLSGLALRQDNTAITKVDYYYPGHYDYGYGEDFSYLDSPFGIPIKVLGGVAGLFSGVISGAFDDSSDYCRPCFGGTYYDSPYYGESYNYGSYNSSRYGRNGYYFDTHDDGREPHGYRTGYSEYERNIGYDYTYYYPDTYYRNR